MRAVEASMSPAARKTFGRALLWAPIAIFAFLLTTCAYRATAMPGSSHQGRLPPADAKQRELSTALRADVAMLAGTIGERRFGHGDGLERACSFIEAELVRAGYRPTRETFEVTGTPVNNVVAELPGSTKEIVVVGAHYDSVHDSPGANDNASGVAVMLSLARELRGAKHARTLRFTAFVNEEEPFYHGPDMGSRVSATRSRDRGERITSMLSLETLGYYTDAENSQKYPFPLSAAFPSTGNFIGFVGNTESRELVRSAIAAFRENVAFPSEGAALPAQTLGVAWSDHANYWQIGVPALMITDTAFLRYPHYHRPSDTPDKLDYERLARVTTGLVGVVRKLAESAND